MYLHLNIKFNSVSILPSNLNIFTQSFSCTFTRGQSYFFLFYYTESSFYKTRSACYTYIPGAFFTDIDLVKIKLLLI